MAIIKDRDLLNEDGSISNKLLVKCIDAHKKLVDRYSKLNNYYDGEHKILSRTLTTESLPNNKIVANHAEYITDMATGYVFGAPITYSGDGADELNKIFTEIDEDSHNNELALDMSIFGVGYELLYMSDDEVPSTTEELYKYMQENTKGGHYGFVEQHSTAYYAAGWLHAFGGYILNENGEPGLDDENTIKALEYHKKFVELMPTEGEYSTVNTLFREGKAHSTIGGPWLVPTARESGIDLGIAPMPTVDETGNKIAPYSGVQGIHVLKVAAERKHDAIAKVLQVLTNDSVGIAMAKASGCAPAKQSCYDDPAISGDDMVMAMYDTAQDAVPMPNVPEMDVMWTVTENLLVDVNMSGKDVRSSAQAAQQQAESLIKQMQ